MGCLLLFFVSLPSLSTSSFLKIIRILLCIYRENIIIFNSFVMSEIYKASILLPSLGLFNDITLVYNSALSEREKGNLPVPLTFLGFSNQFLKMSRSLDVRFEVTKMRDIFAKISGNQHLCKILLFGQ